MWAVTILLTLAVCTGIGELAGRLAHVQTFRVRQQEYIGWAKPDPVLGWRNNPGVHRADESPHEPMTFLSDGSRDSGTPAQASGRPVIIIGCSFAEGYGVKDSEVFSWILQQRFLHRRILNFGTPGYGTYQSLLLLRELIEQQHIHPAAVIYGFIPFHADRNVLTYAMLEAFRNFGGERFSPPHVELRDGGLEAFPPFVVSNWPLEAHSALVTLLHRNELQLRLANRERDGEKVTLVLLREMKEAADREQAPLLVATLWHGGPPRSAAYRRMVDGMRVEGIEQIDITYAGQETKPERLAVGGHGHPGPAIHEWWADKLSPWLASLR